MKVKVTTPKRKVHLYPKLMTDGEGLIILATSDSTGTIIATSHFDDIGHWDDRDMTDLTDFGGELTLSNDGRWLQRLNEPQYNRSMTYEQLINELQKLPKERLQDTVTLFDTAEDEMLTVAGYGVADEADTDVLDTGHFYLTF